jgi:hypothetical protein
MKAERFAGQHEAREALVLSVAGVTAIMLIESLVLLILYWIDAAQKCGEPLRRKRGAFLCSIIAVALILNYQIAVAQQDQYSANFIMTNCREEAALIPFSSPSNEHSDLARFCLGIIVGLSYMGRSDGTICVPSGVTREQAVRVVVQYIDGQPARMNENFVPLAIEALQATWPCKP